MNEINILYFFELAYKRIWALILAFLVFAGGAFAFCKFIASSSYSAKSSVIVTNGAIIANSGTSNKNSVASTDVTASLNLAETITDVLGTPDIYKLLAEELKDKYTYRQLMNMADISRKSEETLFVDIKFTSTDPNEAVFLSSKFAEMACDYIVEYIPYSNVKIAATADSAVLVYPRTTVTTMASGVIGVVIVYAVLFIFEFMDQAIKGEEEFISKYDIPLLGTVPDFESAVQNRKSRIKGGYRNGY